MCSKGTGDITISTVKEGTTYYYEVSLWIRKILNRGTTDTIALFDCIIYTVGIKLSKDNHIQDVCTIWNLFYF